MSIRSEITTLFEEVARDQQRQLVPLRDETKLLESGLDSLSFALIAARLEESMGFNPFDTADEFPVTFGDFIRLYESQTQSS